MESLHRLVHLLLDYKEHQITENRAVSRILQQHEDRLRALEDKDIAEDTHTGQSAGGTD